MADQALMEKLLLVLGRIEERLVKIELNTAFRSSPPLLNEGRSEPPETNSSNLEALVGHGEGPHELEIQANHLQYESNAAESPVPQHGSNNKKDGDSISIHSTNASVEDDAEVKRMNGNRAYFNALPYEFRAFSAECRFSKKYHGPEAEALWTQYVGQWWSLPPDNRIDLSFQRHILETELQSEVTTRLKNLITWYGNIGKQSGFRVQDYDRNGQALEYEQHTSGYYERPIWNILQNSLNGSKSQRRLPKFDFASNVEEHEEGSLTNRELEPFEETAAWRRLM